MTSTKTATILAITCLGLLGACAAPPGELGVMPSAPREESAPKEVLATAAMHDPGVFTNFKANWKARVFGFHAAYTFPKPEPGSYWMVFDGEKAVASNVLGGSDLDAHNNSTDADFYVGDGAVWVRTDVVPKELPELSCEKPPVRVLPHAWPIVITQHIKVGAEGTEFVVQNNVVAEGGDPAHSTQRVFLLENAAKPLVIVNLTNCKYVELKDKDTYVEFYKDELSDVLTTSPSLKAYAKSVRDKAKAFY
jgi:hypothetical protein